MRALSLILVAFAFGCDPTATPEVTEALPPGMVGCPDAAPVCFEWEPDAAGRVVCIDLRCVEPALPSTYGEPEDCADGDICPPAATRFEGFDDHEPLPEAPNALARTPRFPSTTADVMETDEATHAEEAPTTAWAETGEVWPDEELLPDGDRPDPEAEEGDGERPEPEEDGEAGDDDEAEEDEEDDDWTPVE